MTGGRSRRNSGGAVEVQWGGGQSGAWINWLIISLIQFFSVGGAVCHPVNGRHQNIINLMLVVGVAFTSLGVQTWLGGQSWSVPTPPSNGLSTQL